MESHSLIQKEFNWTRIIISTCCGIAVAVVLTIFTSPETFTILPITASRTSLSPSVIKPLQRFSNSEAPRRTVLAASLEGQDALQQDYPATATQPVILGSLAALSMAFGAVAMKLWEQRAVTSVPDVEAHAGAAPMGLRTSAPWASTSSLNLPDFSHESRGTRLVLQAAKGKGKGGGAKGKIAGIIKLALPAGKATPAPPVGPALGQYGLNIVAFCKEYNAATEKDAADGMIIPVEITAFEDRSYKFILKTPPASVLLKKAAKVPAGSATPNKVKVGSVTRAQLEEIARTKLPDLNTPDVAQAMKIVEGTAKNMGITITA